MAQQEIRIEPSTFGNLTVPRRSGLIGLSMGHSLALVPVILIVIMLAVRGWITASLVVAGATLLGAALLLVTRKQGRSIYGRLMLRFTHRLKAKANKHLYLAGPAGFTPDGQTRLPGLMAKSQLSEFTDSYGQPFGLIRLSSRGHHNYSVVMECYPTGDSLVDQADVDSQVAHWAAWLTQRGLDEGIRGASVTIESSQDSGLRLKKLLAGNFRDDAPDFAKQVMARIAETDHSDAPQLVARISVTFDGRRLDGKAGDRGLEDMAEEIGNKLPGIVSGLANTGAGAVRPCSAQEIIDFTRIAYDPTTAAAVEEKQAGEGTGLRWEDAGPSFALDAFDCYRHDRAVSKSWTMYEGPRGAFTSNALARVTAPSEGALRKRVTLLYRPIPADQTTTVVENEQKDAMFSGSQQRVSVRARQRLAAAQKTAQEEALGSGLTRFGMIVTISVRDPEELRRFDRTVPGMVSHAKLRVREALGNQAVTFQAGLPLGMVLPDHMMIPDELRTWFS
ncbi:hypothetical protein Q2T94_07750 [Paeniglutamicibacter sulfureus]|uniref:SCO6880 family protein n=1 Tax=Paeniglutamicibacter sulfureus TaxID=43666 RepID=UPI0026668E84|nr:SCO6880 family protein [Paeniglutamicibacter sulfureus]MDO2934189.1 hypothetical protein [Paeniglutamicibacter sulfureus]